MTVPMNMAALRQPGGSVRLQRIWAAAHALIPVAMWAETDGTFTNFDRRVQRFKRAFEAPDGVGPRWEVALDLLARLGKPLNAGSAGDVFAEMTAEVAAYKDLTHRNLGAKGRLVGDPAKAHATA